MNQVRKYIQGSLKIQRVGPCIKYLDGMKSFATLFLYSLHHSWIWQTTKEGILLPAIWVHTLMILDHPFWSILNNVIRWMCNTSCRQMSSYARVDWSSCHFLLSHRCSIKGSVLYFLFLFSEAKINQVYNVLPFSKAYHNICWFQISMDVS